MSRGMDEETAALAACIETLHGNRPRDVMRAARALRRLKELPDYRMNRRVAGAVGINPRTVGQFLKLLELPEPIRLLLERGKLRADQGTRLARLARERPEAALEAAEEMTGMTVMESRDLAEYLVRVPEATVEQALRALDEAKTVVTTEYHVDTVLTRDGGQNLEGAALRRGTTPGRLATEIVEKWLEEESGDESYAG